MTLKNHLRLRSLNVFLFGHLLNPLWGSRLKRRRIRSAVFYRMASRYFDKYRSFVQSIRPDESPVSQPSEPGRIFSIWFQGEENAPALVRNCFQRMRTVYGNRFVVLDNETLPQWITLPDYVWDRWKNHQIGAANFSDICRVELLYEHGGMWFDATDYLTSPVPEWIEKADLFIYLAGDVITPESFIQSCFMRACKHHPLYGAWREFIFEYWKNEDRSLDYFLLHYMLRYLTENNPDVNRIFYSMPQIDQEPTHRLWYLHHDSPYSDELYLADTKDTFFQKTDFKSRSARNPIPGSVADYIINARIPFKPL